MFVKFSFGRSTFGPCLDGEAQQHVLTYRPELVHDVRRPVSDACRHEREQVEIATQTFEGPSETSRDVVIVGIGA